jgi:Anti-repressor SinI
MMAGLPEIQLYFGRVNGKMITEKDVDVVDNEWKELILEARKLGLSIEDVRNFLTHHEVKSTGTY